MQTDPEVPSAIYINTDKIFGMGSSYSYALFGFSSTDCSDATKVVHFPLDRGTNVVNINERYPVCSLRLGRATWLEAPVVVQLTYETPLGQRYHRFRQTGKACINLCNSKQNQFPVRVDVLEKDGLSANNFVELFWDSNCQNDFVKGNHGKRSLEIYSWTNLPVVTAKDAALTTRSFYIGYERKH